MNRRRLLAGVAATAALALGLSACGGGGRAGVQSSTEAGADKGALIGVAMPTKTSERWIDDGDNVTTKLEELGYKVDLQYANDKVPDQQQQIESMFNKGAKALIIAAIDGTALTQQLKLPADDRCEGDRLRPADQWLTRTSTTTSRSTTSKSASNKALRC